MIKLRCRERMVGKSVGRLRALSKSLRRWNSAKGREKWGSRKEKEMHLVQDGLIVDFVRLSDRYIQHEYYMTRMD